MSTPAGWYDDGSGRLRWWDGQQWTEHFAPEAPQSDAMGADALAGGPDAGGADAVAEEDVVGDPAAFDPDAAAQPIQTPPADAADSGTAGDADRTVDDATAAYAPPPAAGGYPPQGQGGFAHPGAPQAPGDQSRPAAYPVGGSAAGGYPPSGRPYGTDGASTGVPTRTPLLGFIALGLAVVGGIIACVPTIPTFLVGSVLLFAALVIAIVALFQKGTRKWPAITALVVSVVAGVVAIVLLSVTLFLTAVNNRPWDVDYDYEGAEPTPGFTEPATPADPDADAGTGEGRPSAEEVAAGIQEIALASGDTEFTPDQLACYGQYFVDSDIPDETLWVIASGEEALTDPQASTAFLEKFSEGLQTCITAG